MKSVLEKLQKSKTNYINFIIPMQCVVELREDMVMLPEFC